jgi:hypothetical protein
MRDQGGGAQTRIPMLTHLLGLSSWETAPVPGRRWHPPTSGDPGMTRPAGHRPPAGRTPGPRHAPVGHTSGTPEDPGHQAPLDSPVPPRPPI